MVRRVGVLVAAVCAVVGSGCATARRAEAPTSFGDAKRIAIVQTSGDGSAADFLIGEFARQSSSAGRFVVSDERSEKVVSQSADIATQAILAPARAGADEVLLRIDVVEWKSRIEEAASGDGAGAVIVPSSTSSDQLLGRIRLPHPTAVGVVAFRVTAVRGNGTLFAERPYSVRWVLEGQDEHLAVEMAACSAVSRLLADVTPN